jgi:hypothetical protein
MMKQQNAVYKMFSSKSQKVILNLDLWENRQGEDFSFHRLKMNEFRTSKKNQMMETNCRKISKTLNTK